MGKKINKASSWVFTPLLFFCNRAVTLFFAVFCIISGLSARTALSDQEVDRATIKGKVLNSIDSTALGNLKIYLGGFWLCPEYGIGLPCNFVAFDSVETDADGNFETGYSEKVFNKRTSDVIFAKKDSATSTDFRHISVSDPYKLNPDADTSITIYMRPYGKTGIKENVSVPRSFLTTKRGNTVSIRLGDWSYGRQHLVRITDATGKFIAAPEITGTGVINWDTKEASPGVYFLKVFSKSTSFSAKILLNN